MPSVPRTSITLRKRRNLKRSRVTTRKGKNSKIHRRSRRRLQPRNDSRPEAAQRAVPSQGLRDGLGLPVLPFPFPSQQPPVTPNVSLLRTMDQYLNLPGNDFTGQYPPHIQYPGAQIHEGDYRVPSQPALPFIYHPTPQHADPHYIQPQLAFSSMNLPVRSPTPALSYMDDSSNMSLTPVPFEATLVAPSPASSGSTLVAPTPVPRMQLPGGVRPSNMQRPEPGPSRLTFEAPSQDKGKGRAVEGGSDPQAAAIHPYHAVRMAAQDFYQALDAFIGMLDRM